MPAWEFRKNENPFGLTMVESTTCSEVEILPSKKEVPDARHLRLRFPEPFLLARQMFLSALNAPTAKFHLLFPSPGQWGKVDGWGGVAILKIF